MDSGDVSRLTPVKCVEGAQAFIAARRPLDAQKLLFQALRANPDYLQAHQLLTRTYWDLEKYDEALKCAERALSLAPQDAPCFFDRAKTLYYLNRNSEAQECVTEGLKQDPYHCDCMLLSATLAHNAYRDDEALEILTRMRQRYPTEGAIDQLEGWIARRRNQHSRAEALFRRALMDSPDFWGYHQDLAQALSDQGKHQEAVAAQREAVRLNPTDTSARASMVRVLQGFYGGLFPSSVAILGLILLFVTIGYGKRPDHDKWLVVLLACATGACILSGYVIERVLGRNLNLGQNFQKNILREHQRDVTEFQAKRYAKSWFAGPLLIAGICLIGYLTESNPLLKQRAMQVGIFGSLGVGLISFLAAWKHRRSESGKKR